MHDCLADTVIDTLVPKCKLSFPSLFWCHDPPAKNNANGDLVDSKRLMFSSISIE